TVAPSLEVPFTDCQRASAGAWLPISHAGVVAPVLALFLVLLLVVGGGRRLPLGYDARRARQRGVDERSGVREERFLERFLAADSHVAELAVAREVGFCGREAAEVGLANDHAP